MKISAARETEIVAEFALHLEQAYADACAAGCSEAEAMQQVDARFADWLGLAREIEGSELPVRPERPAAQTNRHEWNSGIQSHWAFSPSQ